MEGKVPSRPSPNPETSGPARLLLEATDEDVRHLVPVGMPEGSGKKAEKSGVEERNPAPLQIAFLRIVHQQLLKPQR